MNSFYKLIFTTILIFSGFLLKNVHAQMVILNPVTANQAVSNIVGPGISFSNAVYTGDPLFMGSFTNGNTTPVGLASGIILATGLVDSIAAPSTNFMNWGSLDPNTPLNIPELLNMPGVDSTFDGSILEFDFVPLSNQINVQYVFASEEYNEWVTSPYNDVFGFFISGPGIVGAPNIATVPFSGGLPVNINNVNNGLSVNGYGIDPVTLQIFDGCADGTCMNCAYYVDNCNGANIVFDGNTTILTATQTVVPCSTYHIKLIIADVTDAAWDCAVFLGTDGFTANNPGVNVAVNYFIPGSNTAYEDCNANDFVFSIPVVSGAPTVINYVVGGTTTSGADYPALPGSITIPAGQLSATLPVTFSLDGTTEGNEILQLIVQTSLCGTDTFFMNVTDHPAFTVDAGLADTICAGGQPVILNASSSGGIGNVVYSWDNGAGNGQNVQVNPVANTTYTVTGTDACGQTATDDVTINTGSIVTSTFTATSPVCTGQNSTITYTGSGVAGDTYIWNFGTANVVSGSGQGPYQVNWAATGNPNISLTVVANGCTSAATVVSVVVNSGPTSTFTATNACVNQNVTVNYTGNATAFGNYNWNLAGGTVVAGSGQGPYTLTFPSAGIYNLGLTVTENGCTSTATSVPITVFDPPVANFALPSGQCITGNSFNFTAGGTFGAGATFDWQFPGGNPLNSVAANPNGITYAAAGNYPVTLIITENGCSSIPSVQNVDVFDLPTVLFNADDINGCAPLTVTFTNQTQPPGTVFWNFGGVSSSNSQNPTFTYTSTGVFDVSLTVTDANGCTNTSLQAGYITINPSPIAGFTMSPLMVSLQYPTIDVGDASTGGITWLYTTGDGGSYTDGSFSHDYTAEGIYLVTQVVTNQFGCTDSATQAVTVKPNTLIYIPNTFTPNNDEMNETWFISMSYIQDFYLRVFDRWGEVVYYSDDIYKQWNGRWKNTGSIVKEDMYVYKIDYVDSFGKKKSVTGHVNIVR